MGDDGGVVIDTPQLYARLNALVACFASHGELFGNAGAVQLAHGKRREGGVEEPFVVSFQVRRGTPHGLRSRFSLQRAGLMTRVCLSRVAPCRDRA